MAGILPGQVHKYQKFPGGHGEGQGGAGYILIELLSVRQPRPGSTGQNLTKRAAIGVIEEEESRHVIKIRRNEVGVRQDPRPRLRNCRCARCRLPNFCHRGGQDPQVQTNGHLDNKPGKRRQW